MEKGKFGYKVYCEKYLPQKTEIEAVLSLTDCTDLFVLPGFCDVHVHFREPGFSYKETIATGSLAAAHGGYTDVCTMPNLDPVPDCPENLKRQTELIARDSVVGIHPFGSITVAQLGREVADLEGMSDSVIGFSDDGRGVQDEEVMREAMKRAKKLGKIIAAHCEDNRLVNGGCIHKGEYAEKHNYPGICSESEWKPIERDIRLAKETGCKYHVCHISCKESVNLIRRAKEDGVDISCETAPHYLLLDEKDLHEEGRFKMNPPLRSEEDRIALLEGIIDGTIDMIATDHAPHSQEEKTKGLMDSAFGIVGIETAFPLLYTYLVKKGIITMERLIELVSINPRKRFSIPFGDSFSVWNLNKEYRIDPDEFLSKGKATPFVNKPVFGENRLTIVNNKIIYKLLEAENE